MYFNCDILFFQFKIEWMNEMVDEWHAKERGSFPTPVECIIIFWVLALIWKEVKLVYEMGMTQYVSNLWNLADCFTNMCFVGWIVLRMTAWFIVLREEATGIDPYYPREEWHPFDPYLISEGLFGAGMISSFLKLVHIFSVNPHLGPLQISLGRMAVDILKWLVMYLLVLFAFACGMNQLLWYYADLEYNKCYSLPGGLPDTKNFAHSCIVWRRFANLFETSQSLFWASFGLVSLSEFELAGIKEFTRFWALLMFGSYSVCNIIVLLNMLIAMMSNSYQLISEKSDTEWKFARTKLWINHFETGSTVPPPFNIIPAPKSIMKLFGCAKKKPLDKNVKAKGKVIAEKRYADVVKCIVRRYITAEQKKAEEFAITEDDVSEIRQDINKFRYEMINILRHNNFETPNLEKQSCFVAGGKRAKQMERRVLKGFNISTVDDMLKEAFSGEEAKSKDFFSVIAKTIGNKDKDSDRLKAAIAASPNKSDILKRKHFLGKKIDIQAAVKDGDIDLMQLDADELAQFNPKLRPFTPTTRLAYAKFKSFSRSKKLKSPSGASNFAPGGGDDATKSSRSNQEVDISGLFDGHKLLESSSASSSKVVVGGVTHVTVEVTPNRLDENEAVPPSPATSRSSLLQESSARTPEIEAASNRPRSTTGREKKKSSRPPRSGWL
jgi:transient receptor potential cation channel subfamily C protein 4